MIYKLRDLIDHCNSTHVCIDGKWVPARPLSGPFSWRIRAALAVLTGKADAFIWPENQ